MSPRCHPAETAYQGSGAPSPKTSESEQRSVKVDSNQVTSIDLCHKQWWDMTKYKYFVTVPVSDLHLSI